MSQAVANAVIDRVRSYCLDYDLGQVEFIFHGGEPLLAGKRFFRSFVTNANRRLLPDIAPTFNMQTNGTLIDREWLDLLCELNIGFGISLDGPKEVNDANRVDHGGQGSYDRVQRAIELVLSDLRTQVLFGGLLTVVNLDADPLQLYRLYRHMGVRSVDFLLPDGHYDNPPPRLEPDGPSTPYADWLISLFDAWFDDDDASFHIRLFENILDLIFGGGNTTDHIGGGQNGIVVIETDGGIEPVDVLKICGEGFTKIGYNVLRSSFREIYDSKLVEVFQSGQEALCAKCRSCPVRAVCGGGYLPHRYSSRNGFDNPSVYCRNLMKLIIHIQRRMLATLPPFVRRKLKLEPLDPRP
jgi:uncharacterized protein